MQMRIWHTAAIAVKLTLLSILRKLEQPCKPITLQTRQLLLVIVQKGFHSRRVVVPEDNALCQSLLCNSQST